MRNYRPPGSGIRCDQRVSGTGLARREYSSFFLSFLFSFLQKRIRWEAWKHLMKRTREGWKGRGGQGGGGRRERAVERVEGRNLVNAPYITVMPALSRNYICDALVAYLHVTANDIFQWREADRGYVPRCQASRTNRAPIIEEFGIQYPPIAAPFTRVLGSQFAPFASRLVKPAIV